MNEREKELKALSQCADALNSLEHGSILKVFHMLSIHFDIISNVVEQFPVQENNNTYTNQETKLIDQTSFHTNIDIGKKNTNNISEISDYPSLKELLIKNYPKNEAEWILCYSFYASKFGSDTYDKDQLIPLYEENGRFSLNNKKNFSQNINRCIKNDWIKHINSSSFVLKEEGLIYAKEILSGKSVSTERKRSKRVKQNSN